MAAVEFIGTVISFNYISPSVFVVGFKSSIPIPFRAGQFVSVIVPGAGPGERDLRRAYSITSPPEMESMEISSKKSRWRTGNLVFSEFRHWAHKYAWSRLTESLSIKHARIAIAFSSRPVPVFLLFARWLSVSPA